MIELADDTVITEEMIALAEQYRLHRNAIIWLREQLRTWSELKHHRDDWAATMIARIPGFPLDLNGLSAPQRARVMVGRQDCPIDLEGLNSHDKARVMVGRKDCPLVYSGLSYAERAQVVSTRMSKGWPI